MTQRVQDSYPPRSFSLYTSGVPCYVYTKIEPPARLTLSAGKDARMSIEIKQVHRLSQQLVMTPQLQQAIKLLQLSRMELVDLVREEMMENPILEDGADSAAEQLKQ